jgi:hypothetical protein
MIEIVVAYGACVAMAVLSAGSRPNATGARQRSVRRSERAAAGSYRRQDALRDRRGSSGERCPGDLLAGRGRPSAAAGVVGVGHERGGRNAAD